MVPRHMATPILANNSYLATMVGTSAQRRRDILAEIQPLLLELQRPDLPPDSPRTPASIVTGSRVRILNGKGWYRCAGTVLSHRGQLYWNVLMDIRPGDTHRLTIFRTDKS
jgi:hypothetical protein